MKYAPRFRPGRVGIAIIFVLFFLVFNLIILYGYLTDSENESLSFTRRQLSQDYEKQKINEAILDGRVQELLNIRVSVLKELSLLEFNRTSTNKLLAERNNELEKLKLQITKRSLELERLQLRIKQARVAEKEAKERIDLLIEPPLNLVPNEAQHQVQSTLSLSSSSSLFTNSDRKCQMYNCFDYSRCSLFSPFNVYSYNIDRKLSPQYNQLAVPRAVINTVLIEALKTFSTYHVTIDPKRACLYLLIIPKDFAYLKSLEDLKNFLHNLPYWAEDGRNHLIINLSPTNLATIPMKSMLVQTEFLLEEHRSHFDLTFPDIEHIHKVSNHIYNSHTRLVPAKRKYFVSYLGHLFEHLTDGLIKKTLKKIASKHNTIPNEFLFDFECGDKTKRLCENQTIVLLDSTFNLILPTTSKNRNELTVFDHQLSIRLINCLLTGSVPVVVGGDYLVLPFEEAIDWNRAVIRIPVARLPEIYITLKTFTDADIIEMRRFGTYILRSYFSSVTTLAKTLLVYIRNIRLHIPSPPPPEKHSTYYFRSDITNLTFGHSSEIKKSTFENDFYSGREDKEMFGPLEPPFDSMFYQRNFTLALQYSYSLWNDMSQSPFYTFPSLPQEPILPSEAKFIGSSFGFRPINDGLGGTGREFSEAIGGNRIREQFTIVILTYNREALLLAAIERLRDLPYVNKIIVVWNSPKPPSPDIKWPNINVDIVVIKADKNSLNNRFLPFDDIKTDAVLSVDDDAYLRHDEIILAFRVWREARDQIVGFPARFHSWDAKHSSWMYNSNYTCEISMILTGAAFLHKHYLYLYSYMMPAAIRNKVDEFMNCEDIAMNFLVSHVSRKPPLKATTRWTFKCNECETSLSEDMGHFPKRHTCLNYFASVYGYMPLLYTQYRADSVLFKNRIPHELQKCFRLV